MLEQQRTQVYDTTQDNQTDYQAFSHIKKDLYQNKVFCWIQEGQTANVIKFYNTFPHLINQLYTPNHWNPLMYAVRYGNHELIKFLFQKGMKTTIQGIYNHVSIIHTAVYSGELSILSYVLNNISKNANPSNCQTSPLKISMKTGNPKMVELLIVKGAYYTFGDVLNNLQPKQNIGQQVNKYMTIDTNKDISSALVVEDSTIKDCPIKQTLRWARIKQAMYMRHYAQAMTQSTHKVLSAMEEIKVKQEDVQQQEQKMEQEGQPQQVVVDKQIKQIQDKVINTNVRILDEKHKFFGLSQILLNDDYYNSILRVLVGKGDSILIKNDPVEQKQVKQPGKDALVAQQQSQRK